MESRYLRPSFAGSDDKKATDNFIRDKQSGISEISKPDAGGEVQSIGSKGVSGVTGGNLDPYVQRTSNLISLDKNAKNLNLRSKEKSSINNAIERHAVDLEGDKGEAADKKSEGIADIKSNAAEEDVEFEEEEEEEDEEEPRLKYQRLGGNVPGILKQDAATCMCVSDRMIAVGTRDGNVHVLDFQGNEVKHFSPHKSVVSEISFDQSAEYLASCSEDATVVIQALYSSERERHQYSRSLLAVALDPLYGDSKTRQFVSGGMAGQLIFNTKGWLGARDQILHQGEGPVTDIKWRGSLIAWANDKGVKIFDASSQQRLAFLERPKGSPHSGVKARLLWQDERLLVVAWGQTVRITAISTPGDDSTRGVQHIIPTLPSLSRSHSTLSDQMSATGLSGQSRLSGLPAKAPAPARAKHAEIVATLQLDCQVSGVAPYGDSLVVLAYIPAEVEASRNGPAGQRPPAQRPEVRIVTWQNDELASDALSVTDFESCQASDYALAHTPFTGSSTAGGQWAAGDEPLYYILSPHDIVVARPRDTEDHVAWLLEHHLHEKALAAVEAVPSRPEFLDEVGEKYLDHLVLERKYAQAASLCPKLLRGSAPAWERWVFNFAKLRQLPALLPYIPTQGLRLNSIVYEMVLKAFLVAPSDHCHFLSTVRAWPSSIYSARNIILAAKQRISAKGSTLLLLEAVAELYHQIKEYSEALNLYLQLADPLVFDYIEQHLLFPDLHDKVEPLLHVNAPRAVSLLVAHSDDIPPGEVVPQLRAGGDGEPRRRLLHEYLHGLFEKDHDVASPFHHLQVELYAEFDQRLLLPFLRSSHHYPLDKAYEVCKRRNLVREMVFILGRMGNSRQALALIIDNLHDMDEALEFVTAQNDEELWEELISHAITDPDMVGELLEHTAGSIDPLHLVRRVPAGMPIPRLRDRLVRIIADYRTETSLRHGCNDILKADCVELLVRYYQEATHAVRIGERIPPIIPPASSPGQPPGQLPGHLAHPSIDFSLGLSQQSLFRDLPAPIERVPEAAASQKPLWKLGGSGLCSLCLDPVVLHNVSVVAFFCSHAYHVTCLNASSVESAAVSGMPSGRKVLEDPHWALYRDPSSSVFGVGDAEKEISPRVGEDGELPVLRCILCNAAASVAQGEESRRQPDGAGLQSNGWGKFPDERKDRAS